MASVTLLRLDLCGGLVPGNKSFKLAGNLDDARLSRLSRLLSFGGPWSNHLHALAAVGRERGLETIGIVRGDHSASPSPMLRDAQSWGMQLEYVSRAEYRTRQSPEYLASLRARFGPCLIIPEGGANAQGVRGCSEIARMLPEPTDEHALVVLPVGTGTTLAGVAAALDDSQSVIGVSVLKGARDLDAKIEAMLAESAPDSAANWRIEHHYHCGGYARVNPQLKAFILDFERVHRVALDPVYTGKALFYVHQMLSEGHWSGDITAIHTGGLQGRRGFTWLS